MLLSYIIPVYNGAFYLQNCFDSLLQTPLDTSEFEMLFVDDVSSDNSVEIIELWQKKHENIKLAKHSINKRQGGAKNTGIENARGKYIVFLDQDDTIIPFSSIEFYKALEKENADIYSFKFMHETLPKQWQERGIQSDVEIRCTGVEFCEKYADPTVSFSPWSYWYKREYILKQKIKFAERVLWEDSDWVARAIFNAGSLHCFLQPIYRWHHHSTSISHTINSYTLADRIFMGYRKSKFAHTIETISPVFSELLLHDAEWNIGAVRKIWKLSPFDIFRFYRRIESFLIYPELKRMKIREHFFYQNRFIVYLLMIPLSSIYSISRRIK